jgi:ABC-2 type transport system permease protein
MFPVVFVAPVIQLTMLGYAATTDVKHVPIVVVDGDRSRASRELIERFDGSPYFIVEDVVVGRGGVERPRARPGVDGAVDPAGVRADVAAGRPVRVQVIADGTDSNSTNVALGYATASWPYAPPNSPRRAAGRRAAPRSVLDARIRVWFNPQLESRTSWCRACSRCC